MYPNNPKISPPLLNDIMNQMPISPQYLRLDPVKEAQFQQWYLNNIVPMGQSQNPDNRLNQYDYRGFYSDPSSMMSINQNDNRIHFSGQWKYPDHKSYGYNLFPQNTNWQDPQVQQLGRILTGQP